METENSPDELKLECLLLFFSHLKNDELDLFIYATSCATPKNQPRLVEEAKKICWKLLSSISLVTYLQTITTYLQHNNNKTMVAINSLTGYSSLRKAIEYSEEIKLLVSNLIQLFHENYLKQSEFSISFNVNELLGSVLISHRVAASLFWFGQSFSLEMILNLLKMDSSLFYITTYCRLLMGALIVLNKSSLQLQVLLLEMFDKYSFLEKIIEEDEKKQPILGVVYCVLKVIKEIVKQKQEQEEDQLHLFLICGFFLGEGNVSSNELQAIRRECDEIVQILNLKTLSKTHETFKRVKVKINKKFLVYSSSILFLFPTLLEEIHSKENETAALQLVLPLIDETNPSICCIGWKCVQLMVENNFVLNYFDLLVEKMYLNLTSSRDFALMKQLVVCMNLIFTKKRVEEEEEEKFIEKTINLCESFVVLNKNLYNLLVESYLLQRALVRYNETYSLVYFFGDLLRIVDSASASRECSKTALMLLRVTLELCEARVHARRGEIFCILLKFGYLFLGAEEESKELNECVVLFKSIIERNTLAWNWYEEEMKQKLMVSLRGTAQQPLLLLFYSCLD